MPARKQANQHLANDFPLTDDRFGEFGVNLAASGLQLLDDLLFICEGFHIRCHVFAPKASNSERRYGGLYLACWAG